MIDPHFTISAAQNAQYERDMGTLREALDRGETAAQYAERCAEAWNALKARDLSNWDYAVLNAFRRMIERHRVR